MRKLLRIWIAFLESLDTYGVSLLVFIGVYASVFSLLISGNAVIIEFAERCFWLVLGGFLGMLRSKSSKSAAEVLDRIPEEKTQ